MIIVRSHIGYGSPHKQDTHEAHGAPLGEDEIRLTKEVYGWPADEQVPRARGSAAAFPRRHRRPRRKLHKPNGRRSSTKYAKEYPELAAQWQQMDRRELPAGWDAGIPAFPADAKGMATRVSVGKVLNAVAQQVPWLIGGSADLAPSTMTLQTFEGRPSFEPGNYARPQFALRHSRARHGRGAQRHGPVATCGRTVRRSSSFIDYCGRRSA